jgi:hypothetical protein
MKSSKPRPDGRQIVVTPTVNFTRAARWRSVLHMPMQAHRIVPNIGKNHSQLSCGKCGMSASRSGCFPPWKHLVLTAENAGYVSRPIWWALTISLQLGFDITALQPIASGYTYYAIKRVLWQWNKCSYLTIKRYFITFLKTTKLIICN